MMRLKQICYILPRMKFYNYCVSQIQEFKKKGYDCQWFADLVLQYTSQLRNDKTDEFYIAVAKRINKGPPIVIYGYERPSCADSSIFVINNMQNSKPEDFIKHKIYNGVMYEVEKFMDEAKNPAPQPTEREELKKAIQEEIIMEILRERRQEEQARFEDCMRQHENNMTPDVGYGRGVQKRNGRFYTGCQMK